MKQKLRKFSGSVFLALTIGALVFSITPIARAQNDSALGGLPSGGGVVPCGNTQDNPCNLAHVFRLGYNIVNLLFAAAAVFAVFMIINAAFTMSESMGSEEKTTAAKKHLTNTIWGLLLILIAYLFVRSVMQFVGLGPDVLKNPIEFIQKGGNGQQPNQNQNNPGNSNNPNNGNANSNVGP